MPDIKITMRWCEDTGREGCVERIVHAQNERDHYGDFWGDTIIHRWESHARIAVHSAASVIAFMDITGLEICRDFAKVFGDQYEMPDGADHTRCWHLRAEVGGRYLATTEPYGDGYMRVEAWCQAKGWAYLTLPPGVGLWFPVSQGTRLVFLGRPGCGEPFPMLARELTALPVCQE
jgi:hypothetical protein